jgi:hypothetical protein
MKKVVKEVLKKDKMSKKGLNRELKESESNTTLRESYGILKGLHKE